MGIAAQARRGARSRPRAPAASSPRCAGRAARRAARAARPPTRGGLRRARARARQPARGAPSRRARHRRARRSRWRREGCRVRAAARARRPGRAPRSRARRGGTACPPRRSRAVRARRAAARRGRGRPRTPGRRAGSPTARPHRRRRGTSSAPRTRQPPQPASMADLTALDSVRTCMGHSRRVPSSRTEGRTAAPAEPESTAPAAAIAAPTVASRVLALQRSAGNQAVTALIQRAPAPTPAALTKLQQLLDDDKEEAAIAQMGTLTEDEAKAALDLPHLRKLAVKSFNDAEMTRGIASLKGGTLLQKLRWMIAEDVTDLARVWPLLVDKSVPAQEKTALYPQNDGRSYFMEICNDDEMAFVVDVLGGRLVQKLHWMFLEGTSWRDVVEKINKTGKEEREEIYTFAPMRGLFVDLLGDAEMAALVQMLGGTLDQQLSWMAAEGTNGALVFPKVRQAPDDQLAKVTDVTRKAIKKEISKDDYKRFLEMLDENLLASRTSSGGPSTRSSTGAPSC